jgi:hypothetical protein
MNYSTISIELTSTMKLLFFIFELFPVIFCVKLPNSNPDPDPE